MAESFSRQKSRHAPQKEGGLKICVTPAGTSNELDVQNGWEENTHTQCRNTSESPPPPPNLAEMGIKALSDRGGIYIYIF